MSNFQTVSPRLGREKNSTTPQGVSVPISRNRPSELRWDKGKNTTKIPRWHRKNCHHPANINSQNMAWWVCSTTPLLQQQICQLREKTLLSPPVSEQNIFESKEKNVVRWTKPGPKQTLRKTKITAQCVVSPKNWKPTQLSTQKLSKSSKRNYGRNAALK